MTANPTPAETLKEAARILVETADEWELGAETKPRQLAARPTALADAPVQEPVAWLLTIQDGGRDLTLKRQSPVSAPRPWRESEAARAARFAIEDQWDTDIANGGGKYKGRLRIELLDALCDVVWKVAQHAGPTREQVEALRVPLRVPVDGDPYPGDREWRNGHAAALDAVLAQFDAPRPDAGEGTV